MIMEIKMVKIITDSSALYTREEAKEKGIISCPLCVSIDDYEGKDLEVDLDYFYKKISEGHCPRTSQPSIGEVVEAYESFAGDEVINITIADGLSGTYAAAETARDMIEDKERVTVFNSRTICGPHKHIVDKALKYANEGKSREEILELIEESAKTVNSFLIPQDFDFLRRGGRLTPFAAKFGGLLHLKPILVQTEDGKRLDKFAVKRTLKSSVKMIVDFMKSKNVDENYTIYISHANVLENAEQVIAQMKKEFPKCEFVLNILNAAFITQGGPGCIAIQYIKR